MLLLAAFNPRRGSVAHRFPPQPIPPPRLFFAHLLHALLQEQSRLGIAAGRAVCATDSLCSRQICRSSNSCTCSHVDRPARVTKQGPFERTTGIRLFTRHDKRTAGVEEDSSDGLQVVEVNLLVGVQVTAVACLDLYDKRTSGLKQHAR